jgi:hypothetical protein
VFERRLLVFVAAFGCGLGLAQALAEDLDRGRTPAQLFASDCAGCHKNPRGLVKSGSSSLASFLREHYTASKETAAALAGYLSAMGPAPRGATSPKPAAVKPRQAAPAKSAEPASEPKTSATPEPKQTPAPTPASKPPESDAKPPPVGDSPN